MSGEGDADPSPAGVEGSTDSSDAGVPEVAAPAGLAERAAVENLIADAIFNNRWPDGVRGKNLSEAADIYDALVAVGLLRTEGTDPHPDEIRETLEWYADPDLYEPTRDGLVPPLAMIDKGESARVALAENPVAGRRIPNE